MTDKSEMFRGGRGKEIPDDEEYQLWLVWKLENDRPILVAIDTSEERAQAHVASVFHSARAQGVPVPETFVEDSLANHLYGESIQGDLRSFKLAQINQRINKERGR